MLQEFPYTDMHQLNLDWIIKIAKDFLDQYTHIQQLISDGEESLQNLTTDGLQQLDTRTTEGLQQLESITTDGLQQLQNKADALEALLQQWYNTHSQDIANELAQALDSMHTDLDNYVAYIIQTIPDDYSELSAAVNTLMVDYNTLLFTLGNRNKNEITFSNGYDAHAVKHDNYYAIVADSVNHWGWTVATENSITLFNENLEYVVLGMNGNYCIALALGGTHFGEFLCFECFSTRYNDNTGIPATLTGSSYAVGNYVTITNNGDKTYTVKINDDSYSIDLSSAQITVGGFTGDIETPCIGFVINGASGSYNIYMPTEVIAPDTNYIMQIMNKNTIPLLKNSDIHGYNATGSISDNLVTVSNAGSGWSAVTFDPTREITFIGTEYVVIAIGTASNVNYAMAICLNSDNYGKLFTFQLGTNRFSTITGNILNSSYEPTETVKVSQISSSEVHIEQGGVESIVAITYDPNIRFNIEFGNVLIGNRTFRIYNPGPEYTSPWMGKKHYAFGDSITAQGYYFNSMENVLGVQTTKFGYTGATYTDLASEYTDMIIQNVTPDIITIWAGTNDFGHSNPLSDMETGLRTILTGLSTTYPTTQLIVITPTQRNFDASQTLGETSGLGPNALGKYLIDYVEKIIEVANEFGVPVLDLYSLSGINTINALSKTSDGLHPTQDCGNYIGYVIGKFIEGYKPYN